MRLAPGLRLDPDYMGGGTFALLAKKGWGKTYAMRVMAEEFDKAKVPFVALDPMDAFWGLRAAKDGTPGGGLSVPIFGGPHADAPLEETAGKLMADLVVDEGLSMILSLAHFGTRSAERRFAKDFLDRLYRRNRDLVHVLIDEADLFAPQKPQAGDQPLLGVTENIVRRGRNKGIGVTLGTQRSAVLNKDVLTQVDGLIIGRMIGPTDRNAMDGWVGEHGDKNQGSEIKNELPELATGECWVWIPEQQVLKKVTIREARTFDSSPTRKRGARAREPKGLADIDFTAIESKMADTIERAKADDPKELHRQVAELKKQLADELGKATPEAPMPDPIEIKVPVLAHENLSRLMDVRQDLRKAIEDISDEIDRVVELVDPPRDIRRRDTPPPRPAPQRASTPAPKPSAPPPRRDSPGDISGPQQRVLDACAWWEALGFPTPSKLQVGFLAGYRVSKRIGGTYGNILGQLRSEGLIEYPSTGNLELTGAGQEIANMADIERSTVGLQRAVHERLDNPESRVLQVIIDRYPEMLSKKEAGELAGYTVGERIGGTFGNILGRLRSLGLIMYPGSGLVLAESILFLE